VISKGKDSHKYQISQVVVVFKNTGCSLFICNFYSMEDRSERLCTLASDAAGQLDVLGLDGDTLGVDGSEVGILEETNEVSLRGLLEG
jgi:hypothetical protein